MAFQVFLLFYMYICNSLNEVRVPSESLSTVLCLAEPLEDSDMALDPITELKQSITCIIIYLGSGLPGWTLKCRSYYLSHLALSPQH